MKNTQICRFHREVPKLLQSDLFYRQLPKRRCLSRCWCGVWCLPLFLGRAWDTRTLRPAILAPSAPVQASCSREPTITSCRLSLGWLRTHLGVQSVSEDNKSIEGSVAGQPDFLQWPIPHEHTFQVLLSHMLIYIWNMRYTWDMRNIENTLIIRNLKV